MPTYTYACKKCEHEMDIFHGISAKPRVRCDECGGTTRRLVGAGAGIIFKGSGFYETDYKTKTGKKDSESKSKSDSSESKGDSKGKSDSSGKKESSSKKSEGKKSTAKAD